MRANHQSNGTAGLREDVSAFGASAAATSLLLLRQVEEKVDSCKASTEVAFGLAHICDIVIDAVRKGHLQGELDPEDKVISVYDVALDALSQKNEELKHSIRNCEKY